MAATPPSVVVPVYQLRPRVLTALTLALVVALASLPTLIMPLHPDQATFAMIGRALARGQVPYLDVWDQKPPGLYFIYALAVQGPFDVMRNVRVFDLCWTAATAVVLLELGRRWWNPRTGMLAGLVYGLVHAYDDPWWLSGQPDTLMVLPLALALLLYDAARGRPLLLLATGALLGVVCQLRFQMVIYIPFFPLVELMGMRGGRARLWLQRMVWLGAGVAALQLAMLLYLVAGGALDEFLRTMRYASGYTRLGGPWNGEQGPTVEGYLIALRDSFAFWAFYRMVLVAPAVIGGIYGALVLRNARIGQLVLFALLSYVAIAMQAKFFWYHFGHLFLSFALLGGWTWDRLLAALRRAWSPVAAGMLAGLIVTLLVLNSAQIRDGAYHEWQSFYRWFRWPDTRELYYTYVRLEYANLRRVAFYVRERTRPGDSIYLWGYDPAIYLLADRPPGARFMFAFPFMSDWAPLEWRQSLVDELARRRPVYFIVEQGPTATWITGTSVDMAGAIAAYPQLQEWLATHYEFETEIGGVLLYRRRE